jgi:hypothetical protein
MKLKKLLNLNESFEFLKKFSFVGINQKMEYGDFVFVRRDGYYPVFHKKTDKYIGHWVTTNEEWPTKIIFYPDSKSVSKIVDNNMESILRKIKRNKLYEVGKKSTTKLNESKLSSHNDLKVGEVYRISDVNSNGDDITADYEYVGKDWEGPLHFELIRHFLKPEVLRKYKKIGKDWKPGNSMWIGRDQINLDIKKNRIKKIDNEAAKREWYKFYKANY